MATTHCFARRAQELGASVREGVEVSGIITDGTRIAGGGTNAGIIEARTVIVAANVWSGPLVKPLGIELPVTATRQPMVPLRRPDDCRARRGWPARCLDKTRA